MASRNVRALQGRYWREYGNCWTWRSAKESIHQRARKIARSIWPQVEARCSPSVHYFRNGSIRDHSTKQSALSTSASSSIRRSFWSRTCLVISRRGRKTGGNYRSSLLKGATGLIRPDACSMEHMPSVIASRARRGHGPPELSASHSLALGSFPEAGRTSIKSRVRVKVRRHWILAFCAPQIAEELSIFPQGVCGVLCARKSESVVAR